MRKIQRATSFYQALQQNAFKTNLHFLFMLFIKVGFKETFHNRYTSILQILTLNKKYQRVFSVHCHLTSQIILKQEEENTLPFPLPRINSVFLLYLLLNKCLFSFFTALSYEITMKLLRNN